MSSDGTLRKTKSAGDLPKEGSSSPTSGGAQSPQVPTPPEPSHPSPRPTATDQTPVTNPPPSQTHHPRVQPPQTRYARILAFFGVGRNASPVRRSNISLAWDLTWGSTQIVIIIVFLALSAHLESKTVPGTSEWDACARPLGVWSCLWVGRICFAMLLGLWRWRRERATQAARTDVEMNNSTATARPLATSGGNTEHNSANEAVSPNLLHTNMYKRLTLLSSLLSFTWFLTAHILVYTSVNSCRLSSPHLWWLVFGILCITYLMVLEVVILTIVVFIVAPVLFLFWNIFLMCFGRHPLQNPGMIKPEIGKLSKSIVDRIPLVMYIPPPPDSSAYPIKVPESTFTYPPKSPLESSTPAASKKRFRWFKKGYGKTRKADEAPVHNEKEKEQGDHTWEAHWEDEGYPFVVLEGNRAACAICLMDFDEPQKRAGAGDEEKKEGEEEKREGEGDGEGIRLEAGTSAVTEVERNRQKQLKLEDAGDGAQPLRLLECGHVFHKPCLDPWLTDVSGRCPVCQRAVEIPEPPKTKRRGSSMR